MKNLFVLFLSVFICCSCSNKVAKVIDLDSFGVVGDGITDDTKALQSAINASDHILHLEQKTYKISGSLRFKSNFKLIGNGAKFILSEDRKFVAFILEEINDVSFENFTIVGQQRIKNKTKRISLGSFLLRSRNCKNISIDQVSFKDHAFSASYFSDNTNLKITNCLFENIGFKSPDYSRPKPSYDYDGIFLGAYELSKNVEISNCRFIKIGPGDGDGIHTQTIEPNTLQNVVIKDCFFDGCTARCIKIQSGSDFEITNNIFKNSYVGIGLSMANNVNAVDMHHNKFEKVRMVWGTNGKQNVIADDIRFTHNSIKNAAHVYRTSGKSKMKNFDISNNVVDSIDLYFIDGLLFDGEISNNTISNFGLRRDKSYYMGLLISGDSENVLINNNKISTSIKTHCAIYLKKTTKNIQVINNEISMPSTGRKKSYVIHFSGTSPTKKAANKKALLENNIVLKKQF